MKVLFVLLLISVFYSCKKGKTEKLVIQNNSIALQKAGELLYENNCKSCHFSTKSNGHLLKDNISNHNYDKLYWISYVTNQDSLIKSQNSFAIRNVNDFYSSYRHDFELTSQEIKSILLFLEE